jgi:hypothetical protein
MRITVWLVVAMVAVGSAIPVFAARSERNQVEQRALPKMLLSESPSEQIKALKVVRTLRREAIDPEIRGALVTLLGRGNQAVRAAGREGSVVENRIDPAFHARVCETVAELWDPVTVQALAGSLGTCGWQVHRYLAHFGEIAAPPVLAVVMAPTSSYDAVNEGLIALRMIVEKAGLSLSPSFRHAFREAAEHHLNAVGEPPGTGTTVRWAIDLAVVLADPMLLDTVRTIAADPQAAIARGITDPQLIEQTRKRAADRLAGIPPLPRR